MKDTTELILNQKNTPFLTVTSAESTPIPTAESSVATPAMGSQETHVVPSQLPPSASPAPADAFLTATPAESTPIPTAESSVATPAIGSQETHVPSQLSPSASPPPTDAFLTVTPAESTPIPTAELSVATVGTPAPGSFAFSTMLPKWLILGLLSSLVLCVLIKIILTSAKRRKHKKENINRTVEPVLYASTAIHADTKRSPVICIVRIGTPDEICYESPLSKGLIIGRDSARAQLNFPWDESLANIQCRLDWKEKGIWATELSPNGDSQLNGFPLGDGAYVNPGDTLKLGNGLYRIFWEM